MISWGILASLFSFEGARKFPYLCFSSQESGAETNNSVFLSGIGLRTSSALLAPWCQFKTVIRTGQEELFAVGAGGDSSETAWNNCPTLQTKRPRPRRAFRARVLFGCSGILYTQMPNRHLPLREKPNLLTHSLPAPQPIPGLYFILRYPN